MSFGRTLVRLGCIWLAACLVATLLITPGVAAVSPPDLNRYNVAWSDAPTQLKGVSASMPIGNGDVGANVWIEKNGDVLVYIAKSDSWDENGRLAKVAKVRFRLSPNPFVHSTAIRQTLRVADATVILQTENGTQVQLKVDAHQPRLDVAVASPTKLRFEAEGLIWRRDARQLSGEEQHSAYGQEDAVDADGRSQPIIVDPDRVWQSEGQLVTWGHRNERSVWAQTLAHQNLKGSQELLKDPLLHRNFGVAMFGFSGNEAALASTAPLKLMSLSLAKTHHATVVVNVAISSQTKFKTTLIEEAETAGALSVQAYFAQLRKNNAQHLEWWKRFWSRSFIETSDSTISQRYLLQRFLFALAGRGRYPIKFNGSLFNVDSQTNSPGKNDRFDADYRRWGGPYWFQNTRWPYWTMLAAGDHQQMRPLFQLYANNLLLAAFRVKQYFGHAGAYFPETMTFFGTLANSNYGWKRAGRAISEVDNQYIGRYYSAGLELISMMLDYYEHVEDNNFLDQVVAPIAEQLLLFYKHHYELKDGKLWIAPAQALETFWDVDNPAPDIAGLIHVKERLSAIPSTKRIADLLPPLPDLPTQNGRLVAADVIRGTVKNTENPETWAIFPYRLATVITPHSELGRRTFAARRIKRTGGWTPDGVQAAFLGLTDEAKQMVTKNYNQNNPEQRFPVFWGPNFDWTPDQCHGGVSNMALQSMLMQTGGDRILLFPAWPADWDVKFRLHAPKNTIVEGEWKSGKLISLATIPTSRLKDVELMIGTKGTN
jgi:alpha-L-fucosidase 2